MVADDFDFEEVDSEVECDGTADIFSAVSLPVLGDNLPNGVTVEKANGVSCSCGAVGKKQLEATGLQFQGNEHIQPIQPEQPKRLKGGNGDSKAEPASRIEPVTINHIESKEAEGLITDEKYLGNFRTRMPQIPENITEFEVAEEEPSGKFDCGTVLTTKRFKRFNYPQLRVSEKILEHKYLVTSLKALTTTKPADSVDELRYDVLIPFEDGDVIRLGVISGRSLSKFLSSTVFANIEKEIYLSENEPIRGNLMFALCTDYTEE